MSRTIQSGSVKKFGMRSLATLTAVAIALLLSSSLGSRADAQQNAVIPNSIAAMIDTDGELLVSWDNANPDTTFYAVKWRVIDSNANVFPENRIKPTGQGAEGYTFDPVDDRHLFQIDTDSDGNEVDVTQVVEVAVKSALSNSNVSAWSDWVPVSDGLPIDVQVLKSGADLEVSWEPSALADQEPVKRYALWWRPMGAEEHDFPNYVPVLKNAANEPNTWVRIPGQADTAIEVQLRAVYPVLGKTARSGWYESPGDLRDACRPDGEIYIKIGATGEYPEDRVPLESQVWFFPTGDQSGESFGHAHLLSCVPHRTGSGNDVVLDDELELDVHIQAHLQPAFGLDGFAIDPPPAGLTITVPQIEIRGRTDNGNDVLVDRFTLEDEVFLECDTFDMMCVATVHFTADAAGHSSTIIDGNISTTMPAVDLFASDSAWATRNPNRPDRDDRKAGFTSNGFKQLRIAAIHEVHIDGEHVGSVRAILRSPFDFNTVPDEHIERWVGGTRNFSPNATESSGWMKEVPDPGAGGYATIGINGQVPTEALNRMEPWSLSLHVEADPCVQNCAVARMPVTTYRGFVDPAFHGSTANGQSVCGDGTATSCLVVDGIVPAGQDSIDPTVDIDISGLSQGLHRLVLVVEQPTVDIDGTIAPDRESTLSGLLVVFFEVA